MSKDTIYREDAIKAIEDRQCWLTLASQRGDMGHVLWDEYYIKFEDAIDALLLIPSADRPQGEWLEFGLGRGTRILFCTNCERKIEVPLAQGDSNYDFCPNCGADMREREGE